MIPDLLKEYNKRIDKNFKREDFSIIEECLKRDALVLLNGQPISKKEGENNVLALQLEDLLNRDIYYMSYSEGRNELHLLYDKDLFRRKAESAAIDKIKDLVSRDGEVFKEEIPLVLCKDLSKYIEKHKSSKPNNENKITFLAEYYDKLQKEGIEHRLDWDSIN